MAMEKKKFLIVNIGSASKKYAFYEDGRRMLFAHFEHQVKSTLCGSLNHKASMILVKKLGSHLLLHTACNKKLVLPYQSKVQLKLALDRLSLSY